MANKVANKLRIVGGQWRSRTIVFPDIPGLRPTPDRVRETVFNWLQFDIFASCCLDLYAGSGALGFEAASRGAQSVVQVENNSLACRQLKENGKILQAEQISIVQQDVLQFLLSQGEPFDLVFLDPPFHQGLVEPTCQRLESHNWLAPEAKIYIEAEKKWEISDMPPGWRLLKNKTAGEIGFYLYQKSV